MGVSGSDTERLRASSLVAVWVFEFEAQQVYRGTVLRVQESVQVSSPLLLHSLWYVHL